MRWGIPKSCTQTNTHTHSLTLRTTARWRICIDNCDLWALWGGGGGGRKNNRLNYSCDEAEIEASAKLIETKFKEGYVDCHRLSGGARTL